MSALAPLAESGLRPRAVRVEDLGELVAVSRAGGQGRVYRPQFAPASLGLDRVVVKLYRRAPPSGAASVLGDMVAWGRSLPPDQRAWLHALTAWPLALVHRGSRAAGIVMHDVSGRFAVPFVMPSGRRERVLVTLEHLLGGDGFLELRGLGVRLDTTRRAEIAERVSAGLAFLHRQGIAASDIAPNNLLVALGGATQVCFIDCDSMSFRGRSALPSVQTGDWDVPFAEAPDTRGADSYKLGLVILRLFARSHDARAPAPHLRYVPIELRDLLYRSLGEATVNRPTAGEWQRALRGLIARGGLGERYPGPAPAPTPRLSSVVAPAVSRRQLPQPPVRARQPPAPAVAPAAGLWLRRSVVALWIVAGTVVLLVVLSRLFAAAVRVPDSGGGSTAGDGAGPYSYQYYNPGYYPGGRGDRAGSAGVIQVP